MKVKNHSSLMSLAGMLTLISIYLLNIGDAYAHERWVLTPQQIEQFNDLPMPSFYSELSFGNFSMVALFLLFILGWIRLGFTGARELFPDLQARLASYGEHVPRILRVCLAWMLISSALGFEPRAGVEQFTSPTLFAPDLELQTLGTGWFWLSGLEMLLGLAILFGIYVRFSVIVLMALCLLGALLFGSYFLAYWGSIFGASIYLLLQGPGRHYPTLPIPDSVIGLVTRLEAQPRSRAQFILRVLTGLNMLYLGVAYKIMQPNLAIGILKVYDVPILSSAPEVFSLFMGLVEVSAGLLLIAGILLRPLSIFLLSAFLFFAFLLPETLTEHILYYGVVLSCLINSAGHWHKPEARDTAANILIIGGGIAAMHAAMAIERLAGAYTRVQVTLLDETPNFVLKSLLPEVIGGAVQPGNAVNPLRRVIPQVNIVVGKLDSIEPSNQEVWVRRQSGERSKLSYSELILAQTTKPNLSAIPGILSYASPIDSIGDALHIRKCILDLVEMAEFTVESDEKAQLLTIAVIGSSELACNAAAEICQMLKAMQPTYPVLSEFGWKVHLFEDPGYQYSDFEREHMDLRNGCLEKAGVILHKDNNITSLADRKIHLADESTLMVGLTINACFAMPRIPVQGTNALTWPLQTKEDLELQFHDHIWAAGSCNRLDTESFMTAADWEDLGRTVGYNAWARTQGYATRHYRQPHRWFKTFAIGFHSFCGIEQFLFSGRVAWLFSRLSQLLAMPGLEKNLRIMIDWFLVIPFRSDIAVLATANTARLQKVRFEKGDPVFYQGDEAELAYVVESGRLEIIKDDRKIGELGPGDYFGEIAQSYLNRRTETVRCIANCELTVLNQSDFKVITKGHGMMAKALHHLDKERPIADRSENAIKRIMYVSIMHAPFTEEEINELGRHSSINNMKLGLTGVLISVHEYFFQILEGREEILDNLLEKIRSDSRHRDLTLLSVEYGLQERLFTDWGMRTVCLSNESGVLLQAIRMMLRNIAQSHHIIGRYTQPAVLKLLTDGVNPLTMPIQKTKKIVLAGNMAGFSDIAHQFEPEEVVELINVYLEVCTSCVVQHGGQVAQNAPDNFVAYFPIDQADAAIASCIDALRGIEELKVRGNKLFSPISGHFGLASGNIIQGNIGSSVKMDYTILGEAVAQAVQLAALAKSQPTALLLTEAVKQQSKSNWNYEKLGINTSNCSLPDN